MLFLNLDPYSKHGDTRFHAWQSLYFSAAWVLIYMALGLLTFPFTVVGLPFGAMILSLAHFVLVVLWVLLLIKSLSGKRLLLPVIGEMATSKSV